VPISSFKYQYVYMSRFPHQVFACISSYDGGSDFHLDA
jgi:hypothetical protein